MFRSLLLTGLLATVSCVGLAGPGSKSVDSDIKVTDDLNRLLVISSAITSGSLSPIVDHLLVNAPKGGTYDLIIDSPGGSVMEGFRFLSVMDWAKAQGVTFRCFIPSLAASMAFGILVHCDERHVLDQSFLLWHRARIYVGGMMGSPITSPVAQELADQLGETDEQIFDELLDVIGMPEGRARRHFENETLHLGKALCEKKTENFCETHKHVPGLLQGLRNPRAVRQAEREFLFQFQQGEIIYIQDRYINSDGSIIFGY